MKWMDVKREERKRKKIKSFPYESPALASLHPFLVHSIPTIHSSTVFRCRSFARHLSRNTFAETLKLKILLTFSQIFTSLLRHIVLRRLMGLAKLSKSADRRRHWSLRCQSEDLNVSDVSRKRSPLVSQHLYMLMVVTTYKIL